MRCAAYKVAPDDGLIQSETCRASNEKYRTIKFNYKNQMHLVGLCTYRRMMHGTYNVKSQLYFSTCYSVRNAASSKCLPTTYTINLHVGL